MTQRYLGKLFGPSHPLSPSVNPMTGTRIMSRRPFEAVVEAQDAVLGTGARIIGRFGLRGEGSAFWANDSYSSTLPAASQKWPGVSAERELCHARTRLTPGYFLACSGLYYPSGATDDGSNDWKDASGSLKVSATFYDADATSETVTRTVDLRPSTLQMDTSPAYPGALPTNAATLWAELTPFDLFGIEPVDVRRLKSTLRQWTRPGAWVDVTVSTIGSARIVCGCVHEVPVGLQTRVDDSAANDEIPPRHSWDPNRWRLIRYPVRSESDELGGGDRFYPQAGGYYLLEVNKQQGRYLHPHLVHWDAMGEGDSVTTLTDQHNTTSTTYVRVPDDDTGGYDEDGPGWSIGSAGYARRWKDSGAPYFGTRGVLRVRVQALMAAASSDTATFKVQTSPASAIELSTTSTSYTWVSAWGYLKIPHGPEGTSKLQAFLKCASGNGANVRAFVVYGED